MTSNHSNRPNALNNGSLLRPVQPQHPRHQRNYFWNGQYLSLLLLCVLFGLMLGAAPRWVPPEFTDVWARNRQQFNEWRGAPKHYERLHHDLHTFWSLPPARQEAVRQLDNELHAQDRTTQTRLWAALERYASWLDRLSPHQRDSILRTESPQARLELINQILQQEWIERLPERYQKELRTLSPKARVERLSELRQQERVQRTIWGKMESTLNLRPVALMDFPTNVQTFLHKNVMLRLTKQEQNLVADAEGKWPLFAQTVLNLAEKHPVLPPLKSGAITRFQQLPVEMRKVVMRKRVIELENRWPDFALAVTALPVVKALNMNGKYALGASRPHEFPDYMQSSIQMLAKKLSKVEKDKLDGLLGYWPEFPKELHVLARKYTVVIPNMTLPGPRDLWERIRTAKDIKEPKEAKPKEAKPKEAKPKEAKPKEAKSKELTSARQPEKPTTYVGSPKRLRPTERTGDDRKEWSS